MIYYTSIGVGIYGKNVSLSKHRSLSIDIYYAIRPAFVKPVKACAFSWMVCQYNHLGRRETVNPYEGPAVRRFVDSDR